MNGLIMAAQLLLGLSLLVFIHELGHYIAARIFGIRVNKFYLFFDAWGIKLFSFKYKDTEFGIGWLPLGGYCQIAGMIDESLDTDQMKKPAQDWEFRSKPAWQRLIVMFAGVFLNLVAGIVILSLLLYSKQSAYLSNEEVSRDGVYASELAKTAGFEDGDKILKVNGKKIKRFQDVQSLNVLLGSKITIERGTDTLVIEVPKDTYKHLASQRHNFFEPYNYKFKIDSVLPELPAYQMGLMKGDKILALNGDTNISFGYFRDYIWNHKNQTVEFEILRGTDTLSKTQVLDSTGYLGIVVSRFPYNFSPYSLGSAFYYGTKDAFDLIIANARGLGKIFTGQEKASESLQGPIGMATIYGATWIWSKFWYITGLISLILAFMNLLPIPGLDGGHILFTLYEMITRRKPSENFLIRAQIIGMVLLLGLMVFAIGNDILRLFR